MTSSKAIRLAVEALESRRFLHGDVDVTFNFQPEGTPVPADTIADYGNAYGDRGNGYAYGWEADDRAIMRDRNATSDQRLDSVALMQLNGNHTWELDIPNGTYAITLTSGDARYMDGQHQIDVEGQRVMYGVQSRKKPFLVATKTIDVEDGKLTISPEVTGVNSKLNSVRIVTVHDDDVDGVGATVPVITVNTLDGVMHESGSDTSATFQFKRSGGDVTQSLVVNLDWSGSASTADFRGRPTTVTFPANATTASIELKARTDSLTEGTETAKVKILAAGAYQIGSPSSGSLTLYDVPPVTQPNLPTITVTAPDTTVAEGGGDGAFRITRDLTAGSLVVPLNWTGSAATGDYTIALGSASNTFATRPTSVTFADGVGEVLLFVRAVDDSEVESDESVTVAPAASSTFNIASSGAAATATITDNDVPATKPVVTVSVPDATIAEGGGDGALRVNRDNTNGSLTVNLVWSGTASSGDYVVGVHTLDNLITRPSSVTFKPGENVITMYIRAVNDSEVEPSETVTVSAATSSAYDLSTASATATITDNDTTAPDGSFKNINWSTSSSPSIVLSETTSIVVNNKMYLFGGFNGVFSPQPNVYRFDGSTWTALKNMPIAFTHVGSTEVDGNVWFAGGYISNGHGGQIFGTTDVRIYDPVNDSWSTGPSLPAGRAAGNLVKVGRKLYYFGGETQNRAADTTTMWALDLDNQSAGWVTKASMPMTRNHASSVEVNGKIYVLGGQTGFDQGTVTHNEIQIYDPSTNAWTVASQKLPAGRSHTVSATQYYGGKIIMVAGQQGYNQQTNTVWAIDPSTLVTTALNSFPDSRFSVGTGIVNGKLYAIGGYKGQIATQGYVGTFV